MKKIVKFGGSSLANAEQFQKVGEIIRSDESRRYVVPVSYTHLWMYCVNGWYPNYGCSKYTLEDGDHLQALRSEPLCFPLVFFPEAPGEILPSNDDLWNIR